MITANQAAALARKLEGVTEKDHFGSEAFVANGRIFVTVWHDKGLANLMLSREQQKPFLARDGGDAFRTIDNAWGEHAFSAVLAEIEPALFGEALQAAWENSANKRTPLGARKKTSAKKKPKRAGPARGRSRAKRPRP
jgi:hypothetical protein